MLVPFEFPKFLGNLTEPSDLQFEPRALSDFPGRELASARSGWVPFGEVGEVNHCLEHLLDRLFDHLSARDYGHAFPLAAPTAHVHLANIAANGRASNTTRAEEIFSPLT